MTTKPTIITLPSPTRPISSWAETARREAMRQHPPHRMITGPVSVVVELSAETSSVWMANAFTAALEGVAWEDNDKILSLTVYKGHGEQCLVEVRPIH